MGTGLAARELGEISSTTFVIMTDRVSTGACCPCHMVSSTDRSVPFSGQRAHPSHGFRGTRFTSTVRRRCHVRLPLNLSSGAVGIRPHYPRNHPDTCLGTTTFLVCRHRDGFCLIVRTWSMGTGCYNLEAGGLPLDSTHQYRRCYMVDLYVRLLGTKTAGAPNALGEDREGMLRTFLKDLRLRCCDLTWETSP